MFDDGCPWILLSLLALTHGQLAANKRTCGVISVQMSEGKKMPQVFERE